MENWYERLKKDLIETGVKLRQSDITQAEREELYNRQIDLIVELDDMFMIMNELLTK